MEIFYQSLYKFMGEANSRGRRQVILKDPKIRSKEIYQNLKSAKTRSQQPESVLRKIYRYIVCKYWFCVLLPIWWIMLTVIAWPNHYLSLFIVICSVILIFSYVTNSDTNDWLYIFRLQLHLWFGKLPKPKENFVNPRCIFVHWKSNDSKHVSEAVLKKLQKELSILKLKDLEGTIKIIQNPKKFKILYLIRAAVFTFRFTKIHLLIGIASYLIIFNYNFFIQFGQSLILVVLYTALYSYSQYFSILFSRLFFAVLLSLSSLVSLYTYFTSVYYILPCMILWYVIACWIVFSSAETEYYDYRADPKHNFEVLDVICRLHREIKNESIYFTIVTDDLCCSEKIPEQFRKYFNFIIIPGSNSELTENHGQIFDLGMISNIRQPRPIPSSTNMNLREWVNASLRCINDNTTQFVGEGLKFLSLLIATNNGTLTEIVMLSVVKMQLKAFAKNYKNEISFKNQGDYQKVKDFFGYLQMLEIIPKTSTEP